MSEDRKEKLQDLKIRLASMRERQELVRDMLKNYPREDPRPLPIHRTEAGYPRCSTCDGGGCLDCTDPA